MTDDHPGRPGKAVTRPPNTDSLSAQGEEIGRRIRVLVDQAPPLGPVQLGQLAAVLRQAR